MAVFCASSSDSSCSKLNLMSAPFSLFNNGTLVSDTSTGVTRAAAFRLGSCETYISGVYCSEVKGHPVNSPRLLRGLPLGFPGECRESASSGVNKLISHLFGSGYSEALAVFLLPAACVRALIYVRMSTGSLPCRLRMAVHASDSHQAVVQFKLAGYIRHGVAQPQRLALAPLLDPGCAARTHRRVPVASLLLGRAKRHHQ